MKLEYPRGRPNFFEVYIENANVDFKLVLTPEKENQLVWECEVRKGQFTVMLREMKFISPDSLYTNNSSGADVGKM